MLAFQRQENILYDRRLAGHCRSYYQLQRTSLGDSCMLQDLELTDEEDLDVDQIAITVMMMTMEMVWLTVWTIAHHMNNGAFFYTECQWIHTRLVASRPLYTTGFSTTSCLPVNGLLFEEIEEDLEPTAGDDITLWDESISYWVPYSSSTE